MATTDLSNKVSILKSFWNEYIDDPEFADLFEAHEIGFPLAFAVFYDMAILTDNGEKSINEAWEAFLKRVGVEDTGFEDIGEIYYVS
jgi:hypothetical protein